MMIPFGVVVVVREFLAPGSPARGPRPAHDEEQLAQERLAAVGQLVSGVAHQLNNPLQGVLGYAELMSMSRPGETEPEELRGIRESATRAAGIARNLPTFAGGEDPGRNWQQINGIVQAVISIAPRFSSGRAFTSTCSWPTTCRWCISTHCGSSRSSSTSSRMPGSAIALRREGSTLSARLAARVPGEITIETRHEANPDRIVVAVADNGSGMLTEDSQQGPRPVFHHQGSGRRPGPGIVHLLRDRARARRRHPCPQSGDRRRGVRGRAARRVRCAHGAGGAAGECSGRLPPLRRRSRRSRPLRCSGERTRRCCL